jgi:NADH:ubiquinone oxidoreductase subunit K
VSAEKKQNKEKEIFTFVIVAIACAAILVLGVILVLRYRKEKWIDKSGMLYFNFYTGSGSGFIQNLT